MKKLIILPLIFILSLISALAILDANTIGVNITLNFPTNNSYNSSGNSVTNLRLNASVAWVGGANGMNVSNGTFVFASGTNVTNFYNGTASLNGTLTTTSTGDFFFNISYGNLSEGTYDVHFVIYNETTAPVSTTNQINSSKIRFTIDRTTPVIALERPQNAISLTPSNGFIIFEYTPTETNLGNCSLFLGNNRITASTSGTINSNVSTGQINKFSQSFKGDNASLSWNVECVDLAGLRANGTSRTVNVLSSGFSNIVGAGGGVTTSAGKEYLVEGGKTLAVGSQNQLPVVKKGTFLKQYGWLIALVAVVAILYMMFIWKPKR